MTGKGGLPLGTSGFSALRLSGLVYVDKTDLVLDIASDRGRIFLSRPRRFGKSLLVSTFETLFRDGLKYFGGLDIDGKWDDGTYGVVKLDLSKIKDRRSIGEMRKSFGGNLRIAFGKVGFIHDSDGSLPCLEQIDAWLERRDPNSLVLLVDEYDAPLNRHLDDPAFFDEIRDMLSEFFSLVKAADGVWRFVLVTGVSKLDKAGIFSAFNFDPASGRVLHGVTAGAGRPRGVRGSVPGVRLATMHPRGPGIVVDETTQGGRPTRAIAP